jgi:hypothetical protein
LFGTAITDALDDSAPSVDPTFAAKFCVADPAASNESELFAAAERCCVPVMPDASAPSAGEAAADDACAACPLEESVPRTEAATAVVFDVLLAMTLDENAPSALFAVLVRD